MKKKILTSFVCFLLVSTMFVFLLTTSTALSAQTLKIGAILDLTNPLGLDVKKSLDALVPVYNNQGGLTIGGQKYKISFIFYDSKGTPPTAVAAANRLIFQDKVKFIVGDTTIDAWMPITEENKVVSVVYTPTPGCLDPKWKYTFQGSEISSETVVGWAWFADVYPELKTVSGVWMDSAPGHGDVAALTALFKPLGMKLLNPIFIEPEATDFTAYATKLKNTNAQVCSFSIGSPMKDSLAMKAARDVGYMALGFVYRELYPGQIEKVTDLSLFNGCCGHLQDYQMDDSKLQVSTEAKDAWAAMYGSWDYSSLSLTSPWYILKAGMEKAGSIDPDKVAEAISSGLITDTPAGTAMMISRPDMNNSRTIDTVFSTMFTYVKDGKLCDTVSLSAQQAFDYVKKSGVYGVYK